jgi:putative FmdB family regulatory protein
MPLYDYMCDDCGPFQSLAPMANYDAPCECPECATDAKRVLYNAPRLALMNSDKRHAHSTNERSADKPRRSGHGPNCGCCGGGNGRPSKTLHHPSGAKSFPSKRPWMISH